MQIPTEQLKDRCVYLLDENDYYRFAIYLADAHTFLGVVQKAYTEEDVTNELEEVGLEDPERGFYGEVVPVEDTGHIVPTYLHLGTTHKPAGVWEENVPLLHYLMDLLTSEEYV